MSESGLLFLPLFQKVHRGVIRFSERTFDTPDTALEPAKRIGQTWGSKCNQVFISRRYGKKNVCGECVYVTYKFSVVRDI